MYRKHQGFCITWLWILATTFVISPSAAQNPAPAALPSAQASKGCGTTKADVSAASVVQATGESLQRKHWQPQGGVVQFTVKSFVSIPQDATFLVCFRWRTGPDSTEKFDETRPDRLDRNNDGTLWTITATIPHNLTAVPPGKETETALPLVWLADVRIIASKDDKILGDAATMIGITYPWAAILLAIATIVITLLILTIIARRRLDHEGIKKATWFLRIISTPTGYASLSQLQIVLWTLVVAASAVYVMSLSGDLIEITNGTLVLLGIAGVAVLGAKAHSESQSSAAQAAAATARKDADKASIEAGSGAATTAAQIAIVERVKSEADKKAAAADETAKAFTQPPADQTPRWSDLIVNESTVDGVKIREIDVTRFQMLLFTLITAAFVLMNVVTTYVIPEIPTGFLTLMGISNGVYLGAKVAQRS